MLAWYWRENERILNFGEHITPYILNYFGVNWKNYSEKTPQDTECILIIGSELHLATIENLKKSGIKKFHIWGQGKGTGQTFDYRNYDINFYLVRGETTKQELKLPQNIPTGDPGFVMPLVCPIERQISKQIIYAPHHSNRNNLNTKKQILQYTDYFDVMIPRDKFIEKLHQLVNSEFVITNSLHISIICIAYGVPFCVCLLKGEKYNYPTKWIDVFDWIGIKLKLCASKEEGINWWNTEVKNHPIPNAQHILNTFPKHIF